MKSFIVCHIKQNLFSHTHTHTHTDTHNILTIISPSLGTAEYTNCISAKNKTPHPKNLLDVTWNHPMVRFQFWSFEVCKVPLYCLYFQVHSNLQCLALVRIASVGQIKLFHYLLYKKPFNCVQTIAVLKII